MAASEAVLITGCSSGTGRAAALAFAGLGVPTWASARRIEALGELKRAGCNVVQLDVTDEQSRTRAIKTIEAEHGAVATLVNNAGYAQSGPVEEVTLEMLQRQFDTNLFGRRAYQLQPGRGIDLAARRRQQPVPETPRERPQADGAMVPRGQPRHVKARGCGQGHRQGRDLTAPADTLQGGHRAAPHAGHVPRAPEPGVGRDDVTPVPGGLRVTTASIRGPSAPPNCRSRLRAKVGPDGTGADPRGPAPVRCRVLSQSWAVTALTSV